MSKDMESREDYFKRGYLSRAKLLDLVGLHHSSNYRRDLFEDPDVLINGAQMYQPDRAAQILDALSPVNHFNRMARAFITGQYLPRKNSKKTRNKAASVAP